MINSRLSGIKSCSTNRSNDFDVFIIETLPRFCLFLEILAVIVFRADKSNDAKEPMSLLENQK